MRFTKEKKQYHEVKYIQIPDRQDVYAIFYKKSRTLCLNRCFTGSVEIIIMQQQK